MTKPNDNECPICGPTDNPGACGCEVTMDDYSPDCGAKYLIERCPLHEAAPDLLEALKGLARAIPIDSPYFEKIKTAEKAIARATEVR